MLWAGDGSTTAAGLHANAKRNRFYSSTTIRR